MRHALATSAAVLTVLFAAAPAAAQSIIKNPGDHVKSFEIEPHLVFRPFDTPHHDIGLGVGLRLTVPIVDNGFISTINNSVGISFGVDYMRYDACGDIYFGGYRDCGKLNVFTFPVVMQWNFYLTKSWSVFGEPGLQLSYYNYSHDGCRVNNVDYCPSYNAIDPVLFAGARWHFGQYTALTMRVGWPYWSVGISFL